MNHEISLESVDHSCGGTESPETTMPRPMRGQGDFQILFNYSLQLPEEFLDA